jgi:hypothetical protein
MFASQMPSAVSKSRNSSSNSHSVDNSVCSAAPAVAPNSSGRSGTDHNPWKRCQHCHLPTAQRQQRLRRKAVDSLSPKLIIGSPECAIVIPDSLGCSQQPSTQSKLGDLDIMRSDLLIAYRHAAVPAVARNAPGTQAMPCAKKPSGVYCSRVSHLDRKTIAADLNRHII